MNYKGLCIGAASLCFIGGPCPSAADSADMHVSASHGSSHRHHRHSHEHLCENVTINIVLTIPQLTGTVPTGANVDVTPFAIAPNGEIIRGTSTNIVPANALVQPLNAVTVPKPRLGNYVIGYFITLGSNSPTFPTNTIANFSGVVLNTPIGPLNQTITFPVQTLFLASLASQNDELTVTANFPIVN